MKKLDALDMILPAIGAGITLAWILSQVQSGPADTKFYIVVTIFLLVGLFEFWCIVCSYLIDLIKREFNLGHTSDDIDEDIDYLKLDPVIKFFDSYDKNELTEKVQDYLKENEVNKYNYTLEFSIIPGKKPRYFVMVTLEV